MAGHQTPDDDEIQSPGRKENAAQPLNAAEPNAGAERYPSARKDDAVENSTGERRSFDSLQNPQPRQGAGDGGPRETPASNPVKGKR